MPSLHYDRLPKVLLQDLININSTQRSVVIFDKSFYFSVLRKACDEPDKPLISIFVIVLLALLIVVFLLLYFHHKFSNEKRKVKKLLEQLKQPILQ